jgi:hypothetical protein
MQISLNVTVGFNSSLSLQFERLITLMSALSDAIAAASSSADAAIARVQTDLTALAAQIADLQSQIAAGTATPADLAALADLKAKYDALDPTSPAVLPPTPTPTPDPTPTPTS